MENDLCDMCLFVAIPSVPSKGDGCGSGPCGTMLALFSRRILNEEIGPD